MRFLVFGTGGVGGYFGAKLSTAGEDVRFVARGKHLEAMREKGLVVRSAREELFVPPDKIAGEVSPDVNADVILFCVKSYDTEGAARQLLPALHKDTVVISLQNGIDNEEKIQRIIPMGSVFGGVAYIYSTITAPGEITRNEGPAKIVFGPFGNQPDIRAKEILESFLKSGVDANLSLSIESDLWKKFVFITAVSGITALTRLTLGELLANPETCGLIRDAMQEANAIAEAKGIVLEPTLIDSFFETLSKFRNDTRSSLYYDLANKKPMEVEALAGTVVKLGVQLGIATSIQKTIYASLLPYHQKHVRELGAKQS